MIYRTSAEAHREPGPFASWKYKCIVRVKLNGGREFFRTYVHDSYSDRCKRCRNARQHGNRMASSGNVCDRCGNPFAGFVRNTRRHVNGNWQGIPGLWADSGNLH